MSMGKTVKIFAVADYIEQFPDSLSHCSFKVDINMGMDQEPGRM